MSKETVVKKALDEYYGRSKQISIDAVTGHLDRMEHVERKWMLRSILEKVYDAGRQEK
jgi:hypothetical protein